ncbi:MAG: nitroreductase family protein [Phycisphaerales bacterium]|nr:MAG: nitroreductase family protein [Phycisphaerales bacterium]
MEFMDVIRKRRSVRRFKPDPIPEDVLEQILEAGRIAPSGMHLQNWYFGLITNDDLKRRMIDIAGGQDWIATAPVVLAICAILVGDLKDAAEDDKNLLGNRFRYGEGLIDYLNACPDRKAMRVFSDCNDVLIAGQQMLLAAENFGLRGCWIAYLDIARAGDLLELPDDIACTFLLPIGYPDEEPEPIERKRRDEVVFHNTWRSR